MPTINPDECISCGACFDICEQRAIQVVKTSGHARFEIDQTKCIGCGMCVEECLNEAVKE